MATRQAKKKQEESPDVIKSIISNYYPRPIMKEVTLNVVQRIFLIGVFNQSSSKFDIETLRAVLEDTKEISLSDEEKKEINIQDILDPETGKVASLKWDKSIDKTINLSEKVVKFILEFIKAKSDAKELGVGDAPLLEIEAKIK